MALNKMKIATRVWIGSLIGILGSSVSVILMFLAVALSSSWFSWTKNALSDIGIHGGVASNVFLIPPGDCRWHFYVSVWCNSTLALPFQEV